MLLSCDRFMGVGREFECVLSMSADGVPARLVGLGPPGSGHVRSLTLWPPLGKIPESCHTGTTAVLWTDPLGLPGQEVKRIPVVAEIHHPENSL